MKEKIVYPPILGNVDGSFQSDLMFMTNYKTKNSGFHIIFNFIEITSRKAYSYKMKTKKAEEIIENFKRFLQDAQTVKNITIDNGSEFISKQFKDLAKEKEITLTFVDTTDKNRVGMIERFNRTLRDKIRKYCKAYKTLRWVDGFNDLVFNYNNSIHSRTHYKPNEVTSEIAERIRMMSIQRRDAAFEALKKFKVGDVVRILKEKGIFAKVHLNIQKACTLLKGLIRWL